jgi:hypothetical protein
VGGGDERGGGGGSPVPAFGQCGSLCMTLEHVLVTQFLFTSEI